MIAKGPRAKSVEAWVVRLFYRVYPYLHWHTFTDLYIAVDPVHFKYCERCRSLYSRCPSCGHISLRYTNVVVSDGTKEEKAADDH